MLDSLCNSIKVKNINKIESILLENPKILQPVKHDLQETTSRTPFWEAMLSGHEKIVELLLDFEADPNEPFLFEDNSWYGLTFLQCLALIGDFWQCSKNIADLLIRRGANVNADIDNLSRKTALQLAIGNGNTEYVKYLHSNGAIFKLPSLFTAPKVKQNELFKLMFKDKNIVKFRDKTGRNCLQIIVSYAYQNPKLDIDIVGIAKTLLNFGVSLNDLDNERNSVLRYAIGLQNYELVSVLLEKGAFLCKNDTEKFFPLYVASNYDNTNLVNLILSKGADVNEKTDSGSTALHAACLKGYAEVIKMLIQYGAHVSVENEDGATALMFLESQQYKSASCIRIMIKGIAKQFFFNPLSVSKKDVCLIETDPAYKNFFQKCTNELSEMTNLKFYQPYSYGCVLKMSKMIRKLSNLLKNEDFVTNFEKNLKKFSCYENELRRIYEKATKIKDESVIVEFRLKSVFGDFFPEIVLRKLESHLSVEDLPL